MFDALKSLIFQPETLEEEDRKFSANDKQLAEAALLFHVIAADGIVGDDERQRLQTVLSKSFGLEPDQTARLMDEARQADNEAIDLYSFTRTLKRELTYDERVALIGNMWEMVFADGVVHELEDNIVWRVAELLDVEARDRMMMKREVRQNQDDI